MERHVREAYDRLKASVAGFVDSPPHREDVIVYALNRLPPRYVVTDAGKAVTEVSLDSAQERAAIDVKVLEAMRHVAERPRR
ncbi:MAG: late competence development ComFB family protein [Gemmatimonadales bacterium]